MQYLETPSKINIIPPTPSFYPHNFELYTLDYVHTLWINTIRKWFLLHRYVSHPRCSDTIPNTNSINFTPRKKVEQSDFGINKPSDALCNFCLSPFDFAIIFNNDKKDGNKVVGNARIHVIHLTSQFNEGLGWYWCCKSIWR